MQQGKIIMKPFIVYVFLSAIVVLTALGHESDKGKGARRTESVSQITALNPAQTLVDINNVTCWIRGDGYHDPIIEQSWNGTFPKGTAGFIYAEGILWGGQVNDGQSPIVRVNGSTYSNGNRAGRILTDNTGHVIGREPDDAATVRPYRVRRDWAGADLTDDAANFFIETPDRVTSDQIDQIREQYLVDWVNWPAEKGAPYDDRDGVPGYTPDPQGRSLAQGSVIDTLFDIPGIPGADQTFWTVYNDLDGARSSSTYGSPSIGFEVQETYWAYALTNPLGNVIFKRVRMIYKGTTATPTNATIDSMYIVQWADPDNGQYTDDFAGCDTALSLGYIYNSSTTDAVYFNQYGLAPPAGGYDFLQGAIVPGEATDSALFDFKYRYGFKNLPMTVFTFFAAGSPRSDPDRGGPYVGTLQWYNLMTGFEPRPEYPVRVPLRNDLGEITKFELTGDPITGSGDIDGKPTEANSSRFPPGDRRIVLSTGPFKMSRGDTQEVVLALAGGLGTNYLSSVSVLKYNDAFAQFAYDNFFVIPTPPSPPKVNSSELDGEVVLEWGSDSARIHETEDPIKAGFAFEGYNIYQLPADNSELKPEYRIATVDVKNLTSVIFDKVFDYASGFIIEKPVIFGTNSGIKRYFSSTHDAVRNTQLVNGQSYYFAVTAYSYNPYLPQEAPFRVLESTPVKITAIPHAPNPGIRYNAVLGDTVKIEHVAGASDGNVLPIVIDPAKLTGHRYEVRFDSDGTWRLVDSTKDTTTLISGQTNQSGDDTSPIVDGMQIKVFGAANDFKDFLEVANANGPHDPTYASFRFNNSGFPTQLEGDPDRPTPNAGGAKWGIETGITSGAYDYQNFTNRITRNGTLWSKIVPFDFEIRFTGTGKAAYFGGTTLFDVTFEIWNIGVGTPNDPSDDYRLIPEVLDGGGLEVIVDGVFGFDGVDHTISGADNDPETDWIYWHEPADKTPGQGGYNAWVAANGASGEGGEVMARFVFVNYNGGSVSDPSFPANVTQHVPETGTVFRVMTAKPNYLNDIFRFTAPSVTNSQDLAKTDVERINVFPNPYYGYNARERTREEKYVTFSHLPSRTTIRIFNLSGTLVRVIDKSDQDQFIQWNLRNDSNLPVASGIYVVHIDMPDLGKAKVLKVAIIQEEEILRVY